MTEHIVTTKNQNDEALQKLEEIAGWQDPAPVKKTEVAPFDEEAMYDRWTRNISNTSLREMAIRRRNNAKRS